MNYLDLCKLTRQECSIQGSGPSAVTSQLGLLKRIVEWVRDADMYVLTLHPDWNFLWAEHTASTTASSYSLAKPDDFGMWDRESFGINRGTSTGQTLNLITYQEWRKTFGLKTNAKPSSLCIMPDGSLSLSAPADGTYTLYGNYWKKPTELSGDTGEPLYPARFQRIIVAKVKMWFFEDIESVDQWKQAEKEFNEWLVKLESFALPNQQEASQSSPELMAVRPL